MAPTRRSQSFRTPSPEPLANKEATTTRKTRFYNALAREGDTKSLRQISKDNKISEKTGRRWKAQYLEMGELAKRRTRPRSKVLGHKSRVSKSTCKMLVSPSRNPVRKQPLETQIAYHDLPVGKRQLRRLLKKNTKGGGMYKCAFVKKVFSAKNRRERVTYGLENIYKPLFGFFDHIVYTDEAHVDPTSQGQGRVLRERGTRNNPENIEERPPLKGVRLHIAAWISWWGKADKLRFYNDEKDEIERSPMPPKPRRRPKTESPADYDRRLAEWEALRPHDLEVKVSQG